MIKKLLKKLLKKNPAVAVITLNGIIGSQGRFKSGINIHSLNDQIEKAFKIPNLKLVALSINSPGGSPVQSELVFNRIRQLSKQKNIKVISFAEDVAASGGYWLLCAGDEVYASENSIIGSIGVISASFGLNKAIEKLGIERRVYAQGNNKSLLDPFQPEKSSDVEILKNAQQDVHESFIKLVKSRREGKLKGSDDQLFNGEFWSGKKAKELGLIDENLNFYDIIYKKLGDKVNIIYLNEEKSWLKKKLSIKKHNIIAEYFSIIEESFIWKKFGL